MKKHTIRFSDSVTDYYLDSNIMQLKKLVDPGSTVIITDENIYSHYKKELKGWSTVVLSAGEEIKVQATADAVINNLIDIEAGRNSTLIGIGGGVVTDIAGYVASIYMRGISFGFVPTSLLAMVDACIGGKNGVDVGVYKNMVGVIRQPRFILFDMNFLNRLPQSEWENGFAEIIKHACIKDAVMFRELEANSYKKYRSGKNLIQALVERNVFLKTKLVQQDEHERGDRRLLNFGHTLGHALEIQYSVPHGRAIAVGMVFASLISEKITGFRETTRVAKLLLQYDLPTFTSFDKQQALKMIKLDKKRENEAIRFVLLEKIGKGVVHSISLKQLEKIIQDIV